MVVTTTCLLLLLYNQNSYLAGKYLNGNGSDEYDMRDDDDFNDPTITGKGKHKHLTLERSQHSSSSTTSTPIDVPKVIVKHLFSRPLPTKVLKFSHVTKTGGSMIEDIGKARGISWGKFDRQARNENKFDKLIDHTAMGDSWWHKPLHKRRGGSSKVGDSSKMVAVNRLEKYDWFMVIRNPFTRIVSEFHCQWGGVGKRIEEDKTFEPDAKFFNKFVKKKIKDGVDGHDHYRPQVQYLTDTWRLADYASAVYEGEEEVEEEEELNKDERADEEEEEEEDRQEGMLSHRRLYVKEGSKKSKQQQQQQSNRKNNKNRNKNKNNQSINSKTNTKKITPYSSTSITPEVRNSVPLSAVMHVIKYEQLPVELPSLMNTYELDQVVMPTKKVNQASAKLFGVNDFDESTVNMILEVYREDFEVFGYSTKVEDASK